MTRSREISSVSLPVTGSEENEFIDLQHAPLPAARQGIAALPGNPGDWSELVLEAALFASSSPLSLTDLGAACAASGLALEQQELAFALDRLERKYRGRAVELVQSAGGYRFRIRKEFAEVVHSVLPERPPRLSRATLETLAIIVYRQPVTRAEIEEIRGVVVNTQIMRNLLHRGWVHVVGHREVPGRPALYATTRKFLDDYGLSRLDELPPLDALREHSEFTPG